MNKTPDTNVNRPAPAKRAYKRPKLTVHGPVKSITLKTGSNVDGYGSFG